MTALAPTLQAFFIDRLIAQRHAGPHTIRSYRDTMRLLLAFAHHQLHVQPAELDIAALDGDLIAAFLDHLEHQRENTIGTRNARLAAIHSLYRFASLRHPEHAAVIARVLAIPPKRHDRTLITHLDEPEIQALLDAPDRRHMDRAARPSDVPAGDRNRPTRLRTDRPQTQRRPARGPRARCLHRERTQTPHHPADQADRPTPTNLAHRARQPPDRAAVPPQSRHPADPRRGRAPTQAPHTATAALACPTLHHKTITPPVLRHTAAMRLLHAGVDTAVIALWLGHEQVNTTQIYLNADMAIKERALALTKPAATQPGRYKPPDKLIAFLEAL